MNRFRTLDATMTINDAPGGRMLGLDLRHAVMEAIGRAHSCAASAMETQILTRHFLRVKKEHLRRLWQSRPRRTLLPCNQQP